METGFKDCGMNESQKIFDTGRVNNNYEIQLKHKRYIYFVIA
jgi:hypothetical protein